MDPNQNQEPEPKYEGFRRTPDPSPQDRNFGFGEGARVHARVRVEEIAEKVSALSASEIEHVRHVLTKHFFHDKPDDTILPGSAGYCPHCDHPVTMTHTDGTAICSNGHRFPMQSVRRR